VARTHVTVIGLGQLRRELGDLDDEIHAAALKAVEESARAVQSEARDQIRVRTGRARRELKVRVRAADLFADVGWSDPDVYYVKFLEYGTSSITADPVLTRAAEAERRRFPGRVTQEVRREVGR
jgi:HK97 gp10 family phage protein